MATLVTIYYLVRQNGDSPAPRPMEALPLPVLADPAPEIDPRRAWATIARSALAHPRVRAARARRRCDRRATHGAGVPVPASIRIDARPGTVGRRRCTGCRRTTSISSPRRSRSSTAARSSIDVADSLGLRLQVVEPPRGARSAVIAWSRVDGCAPMRSYSVRAGVERPRDRAPARRARRSAPFRSPARSRSRGVRSSSRRTRWPTATSPSRSRRSSRRRQCVARTQVTQPNLNANIVLVTYEGNDPRSCATSPT